MSLTRQVILPHVATNLRLLFAAAVACTVIGSIDTANAGEVFESVSENGVPTYSNFPVDASSRRIATYSSQSPQPRIPSNAPLSNGQINRQARLRKIFAELANKHDVPLALVHAVAQTESAYRAHAISEKGALGIMQLMPATAERYGVTDPFDPIQNISAGVRHLKRLMDVFDRNIPLVLAAYNAGENAVRNYGNRVPPYTETMLYFSTVLAKSNAYSYDNP